MFGGSLLVRNSLDLNALSYIAAVELADGQRLEGGVKRAINSFVVGCKSDGTWDAIKASCIMAGARTLDGALVPLKGIAPNNFDFVAGDYNRKTGLKGDGNNKYLNSNRNNNTDPQDSQHLSFYATENPTQNCAFIGCGTGTILVSGQSHIGYLVQSQNLFTRSRGNNATPSSVLGDIIGFNGISRASSVSYTMREKSNNYAIFSDSQIPFNQNIEVFGRNNGGTGDIKTNARLSFYSIGESIDLAKLDARVTALMNDFNLYIP